MIPYSKRTLRHVLNMPEVVKVDWSGISDAELPKWLCTQEYGSAISHGSGKVHLTKDVTPYQELFDNLTACWCESTKLEVVMFNGIYHGKVNILVVESSWQGYDLDGTNVMINPEPFQCDVPALDGGNTIDEVIGNTTTQMAAVVDNQSKALLKGTVTYGVLFHKLYEPGADMVVDKRNFKGKNIEPGLYSVDITLGLYNQSSVNNTIGFSRLNAMGVPGFQEAAANTIKPVLHSVYRSIEDPAQCNRWFGVNNVESSPVSLVALALLGDAKRTDSQWPPLARMEPVVRHIKSSLPRVVTNISRQPEQWHACMLTAVKANDDGMWCQFVGDGGMVLPDRLAHSMGADCDGDIIGVMPINQDQALIFRTPVMCSYIAKVWIRGECPHPTDSTAIAQHLAGYADEQPRNGLGKHLERYSESWDHWLDAAVRMRKAGWYTGMACNAMGLEEYYLSATDSESEALAHAVDSEYFASLYQMGVDSRKKVTGESVPQRMLSHAAQHYSSMFLSLDRVPLVWAQKHSVSTHPADQLSQMAQSVHNRYVPSMRKLRAEGSHKYLDMLGTVGEEVIRKVSIVRNVYSRMALQVMSVPEKYRADAALEMYRVIRPVGQDLVSAYGNQAIAAAHRLSLSNIKSSDITVVGSFAWQLYGPLWMQELYKVVGAAVDLSTAIRRWYNNV